MDDLFYLGVKVILKNAKNKILLLQVQKTKRIFWELPGGRVQKNETEIQALMRELAEETGITSINNIQSLGVSLSKFRMQYSSDLNVGLIFSMWSAMVDDVDVTLTTPHVSYQWASVNQAKKLLKDAYGACEIK
ncbi:NUDIX domain-containing protein [Candidatus Babeliales bacterium]|nr:NUDIX domain-containing protein [Candidatus Babeliales bacterium]